MLNCNNHESNLLTLFEFLAGWQTNSDSRPSKCVRLLDFNWNREKREIIFSLSLCAEKKEKN